MVLRRRGANALARTLPTRETTNSSMSRFARVVAELRGTLSAGAHRARAAQVKQAHLSLLDTETQLSASLTALQLSIPDVLLLQPVKHSDSRGFLSQTYNRREILEIGIDVDFVQDNHSMSQSKGVVRGLHFQIPPAAQDKLVRVSRGAIFDVAVDLRRGSANFGKSVSASSVRRIGSSSFCRRDSRMGSAYWSPTPR